jgi:hypothetical protein
LNSITYDYQARYFNRKKIEQREDILKAYRNISLGDLFDMRYRIYNLNGIIKGTKKEQHGYSLDFSMSPKMFKHLIDTNHGCFILPNTKPSDNYIIPKEILEQFHEQFLMIHHKTEIIELLNNVFYKDITGIIMGFL